MTPDSYVYDLLNTAFARGNPLAPLSLFFLFLARFLPIIALSPFFGARVLPHPVKIIFALCMFVIFLPYLLVNLSTPLVFNVSMVFLFFKELFVGLCLGYLMSMPFTIVQSVGIIIDHQRGGASLMVNDPTIQNQSSPLGTLFNMILIYLFYVMNGPFLFIDAIAHSYKVIPPDQFFNPNFFMKGAPFFEMMVKLFQQVMTITLQISSPALLAILMTDVFLGIANRLAPQVQITFLGMPLKSLLALMVVCIGWKLLTGEFVHQSNYWLQEVRNAISLFNPGVEPADYSTN